jgi:hypothetical protein
MVLLPYVDLHSRWRLAAHILAPLTLALVCFVYGFFFALTAPYLIVPFTAPVAVLGLLSIWALPEARTAPVRTLEVFFSAVLIGLVLWPNYLALSLPGLPWITMVRLTTFPMGFLLLLCLSISSDFRRKILEAAQGAPLLLNLLLIFSVNSFVSLPLSHSLGESVNKVLLQLLNWTGMFLAALYVFRTPGRAQQYVTLLIALGIPIVVFSAVEFEEQHVLWAAHVPSFLRVDDPSAQLALSSAVRGAIGLYRTKATFSTPLGLAEFISLLTPFAIHWVAAKHSLLQRVIGLCMLPAIYVVVRMTDARLGILGYMMSTLTYVLVWSMVRFRRRLNDLVAAIIVYAYPAAFLGVLAASLFVHKIHVLMFGGGAQAGSNEHRQEQFVMAIPSLLKNPIGYGAGESGRAMGYGAGDFVAIDSYFINIALDYGVVGLFLYSAMFALVIATIVRTLLQTPDNRDPEVALLIPLAACLTAFVMIRGVFGQADIHPMIFTLVGMAVCLVTRAQAQLPGGAGRIFGGGAAHGPAKKMNFATLGVIVLFGSAATYAGCFLWWLKHH